MAMQTLFYKKLSSNAYPPVRATEQSAGYDLRSAYEYSVSPHGKLLVKTDLAVKLPHKCYGRIAPRSGLALKHHINIGAGVIDRDYRGNVGVVIFNHSSEHFKIKKGDRIAQLICERIFEPDLKEVESLDETGRGECGFGSTGGVSVNDNGNDKTKELALKEVVSSNKMERDDDDDDDDEIQKILLEIDEFLAS